jgi:hypothetical protein
MISRALTAWLLLGLLSPGFSIAALPAPSNVRVFDAPNDAGGALTLVWEPSPADSTEGRYQVLIRPAESTDTPKVIAEFPANTHYVRDAKMAWWSRPAASGHHLLEIKSGKGIELKDGTSYAVSLVAVRGEERTVAGPFVAVPSPAWVNWNQLNNLLLVVLFAAVVFWSITVARRRDIFLRRIPG